MAKYPGKVGIMVTEETAPGKWEEIITERECMVELKTLYNRYVSSESQTLYEDISLNNQASIVADPYINSHFPSIKYLEFKGIKWRVRSVDATKYPRLIMMLGEVYTDVTQT